MALQKQDLTMLIGTGIETKQDPKLVQPGKLLVCENSCIDTKTGSSYKRSGHDALPLDTSGRGQSGDFYAPELAGIQKVATLNDELVAITADAVFGYSESKNEWAWKGYIGNALAESATVMRGPQDAIASDVRINNGYMIVATVGINRATGTGYPTIPQNNLIVTVLDAESKKVINESSFDISSTAAPITFDYKVRCVNKGQYTFIYVNSLSSTQSILRVSVVDTANPEVIAPLANVDSPNEVGFFDVCEVGSNAVLLKTTRGATFDVKLAYLKDNGQIGGLADGLPANPLTLVTAYGTGTAVGAVSVSALATGGAADKIYAYYADNSAGEVVQGKILSLDFATTTTANIAMFIDDVTHAINSVVNASQCYVVISKSDSVISTPFVDFTTLVFEVSILGTVTLYANPVVGTQYSKPFFYNGFLYYIAMTIGMGSEQKSYFLLKASPFIANSTALGATQYGFFPVCQMLVNEGLNDSYYKGYGNSVVVSETGSYVVSLQRAFTITSASSSTLKTAHLTTDTTITFDSPNGYQVLEKEGALYITSGILFVYDGNYVFENGFLYYPKIFSVGQTGSGNVPVGSHTYQSTFEWTDRAGNKHISAPSLNSTFSVTGSSQIVAVKNTVQGYSYKTFSTLFQAIKNYGVAVYRTTLNSTVRYKATLQSPEPQNGGLTSSGLAIFSDNVSDTDIAQKEIIYTNGGVIENISSGSGYSIEDYQGRIILTGREDKNTVLFSKQKRPSLAYQFNPDLSFIVPESNSGVRSVKTLDEKLILFKDTSLYIQAGQGPSDTGENSDYLQNPQRIASNVGCPYPKSIVRFNEGIMFKSYDGFYLLDRSLGLDKAVGEAVSYFNDLTVRDSVLMEDRNEIRWVHSDGVCLVYNYFLKQWSVFTNHEAVSCTVWKNRFVMAKTDGAVWVENPDTNLDDGEAFSRRIVFPWIALAGLQHAQRLYRLLVLGEMRSPHRLKAYIAYDYEPARREEFTFDSRAALGDVSLSDDAYFTVPPDYTSENRTYDVPMRPAIQKCEAFRIELIDENLEDENGDPIDGGCAVWTSITLTLGVKKSTLRSSSSRRATPSEL